MTKNTDKNLIKMLEEIITQYILMQFPSAALEKYSQILSERHMAEGAKPGKRMARVYSAGPAVFRADALSYADDLHEIATRYDFTLLHPLDAELSDENKHALGKKIYESNLAMIRDCDFVIADLNAFRSKSEMDPGTAFEIGFACALGKKVYGFMDHIVPMVDIPGLVVSRVNDVYYDEQHKIVEDFGMPANLMISYTIGKDDIIEGNFETVLQYIKMTHPTSGMIFE